MTTVTNNTEQWFLQLLKNLREGRFYGKIVLELKEGKVVLIRREETIKPPQIR